MEKWKQNDHGRRRNIHVITFVIVRNPTLNRKRQMLMEITTNGGRNIMPGTNNHSKGIYKQQLLSRKKVPARE